MEWKVKGHAAVFILQRIDTYKWLSLQSTMGEDSLLNAAVMMSSFEAFTIFLRKWEGWAPPPPQPLPLRVSSE